MSGIAPRLLTLLALGACGPSRSAVFGPVDREIERRLGEKARWGEDPRVAAAIASLLQKPLDREAAIRIALATNRRLQASYDQLGIAASEIASATVLPPTRVDVEVKLASGGAEVEVDVIQDVLALVQVPQRRGIAQAELAAARARAVAATVELVARVEAAYIDLVAAAQELELRQTAFDAANASAVLAERIRAAGNISELDLARELDQRELARIDLGRAQVDLELRREAMNEVLGLSGNATHWTVAGRLPDPPELAPRLDGLERDSVAASLALEATRADAEAAAGRVGLARVRAWLPELGLGVSGDHRDGTTDVGPAISVGIPLFDQQQGPRARAHAELSRARNEAIATAVELRARARAARERVLGAHAEARHLQTVVLPLRQRILDEAVKQYNAMNVSTFELLTARRELVEAGRRYIDAVRRYWRAEAAARALARGGMAGGGDADEPSRAAPRTTTTDSHQEAAP